MAKKQPEYYPQGGVHLKHAAISPYITRTVSGVPPLTIRTSKPRTIKEITIYGNTVAGAGVGDKTSNLLPSYICRQGQVGSASPEEEYYNLRTTLAYPFPIAAGNTYTIYAANPNNSIKSFCMPASEYDSETGVFSGTTTIGWGWSSMPKTVTIPSSVSHPYLAVTLRREEGNLPITAEEATALKLYIVEGSYTESTAPEYEPCGYRIPVKVRNSSSEISSVFYTDAPLYTPNDTFAASCDGLLLYPGNNILTVNTSVSPSSVEVIYRKH